MRGSHMIMLPAPWENAEPAQFRLAGFGGAALFLRSQVLPGGGEGSPGPRMGVDLMLLAPDYHVWYLGRPGSDGLVDRLADWFLRAAADFEPQDSVSPLVDEACGLRLTVTTSTDAQVCIEVSIRRSMDGSDPDVDELDFFTSRYAIAAAADAVHALDGSWPDAGPDYVDFDEGRVR